MLPPHVTSLGDLIDVLPDPQRHQQRSPVTVDLSLAPQVASAEEEEDSGRVYSCVSCEGTSISDVTSSCWERADLEHTRFVGLVQCPGSCAVGESWERKLFRK